MSRPFTIKNYWMQLVVGITVVIIYGNTLDVPFYLDDYSSIVNNPTIYDVTNLAAIWKYYPLRFIGYLTFAFNYQFHHYGVAGYHIVNIIIHIMAGLTAFSFTRLLLSTPGVKNTVHQDDFRFFPLLAAILFVCHPLQTQGVTYIIQRFASMAALFYILAMMGYLHFRLNHTPLKRYFWLLLTVLFGSLAILTKQNTVTLPLALFILEVIFFKLDFKKALIWAIAFVGITIISGYLLSAILHLHQFSTYDINKVTRMASNLSRKDYFLTQTHIVFNYIKLFFYPVGLRFDYETPVIKNLSDAYLFILFHGVFLILAIVNRKKYPVISFGILFYYVAHMVESSLLPIRDLCFEHRTYLPNLGLCISLSWLLEILKNSTQLYKSINLIWIMLCLTLCLLTVKRNQQWRDPVTFWSDNIQYEPRSIRAWDELGFHLMLKGEYKRAALAFLRKKQGHIEVGFKAFDNISIEAAINLIKILHYLGRSDMALQFAQRLLKRNIYFSMRFKILINMGCIYYNQHRYQTAVACFKAAYKISPFNELAIMNLFLSFVKLNDLQQADSWAQKLKTMKLSDSTKALFNKKMGELHWK